MDGHARCSERFLTLRGPQLYPVNEEADFGPDDLFNKSASFCLNLDQWRSEFGSVYVLSTQHEDGVQRYNRHRDIDNLKL